MAEKIKLKRISASVDVDIEITESEKNEIKSAIRKAIEEVLDIKVKSINTIYDSEYDGDNDN